jgi:hypothetical protein
MPGLASLAKKLFQFFNEILPSSVSPNEQPELRRIVLATLPAR